MSRRAPGSVLEECSDTSPVELVEELYSSHVEVHVTGYCTVEIRVLGPVGKYRVRVSVRYLHLITTTIIEYRSLKNRKKCQIKIIEMQWSRSDE
jgi:hypothetical protein